MMYYIERPYTWRAANRKCEELLEFVNEFQNCLIADELSRDVLIEEIRKKVKELDAAYPRTKKLKVWVERNNESCFCCPAERTSDSDTIFSMAFHPVRKTYRFAEKSNVLKEGGTQ